MDTCKMWIIERADTGEALGQFKRGDGVLEFGGRAIVYWSERRFAKQAWFRYCIEQKWITRGITLAHGENRYAPGPKIDDCPDVLFRQVTCTPTDGVVPFSRTDLEETFCDTTDR